jgi:hypothetical protein
VSEALKRIEEKHFKASESRPVRHCEPSLPCDVVKLARALDEIATLDHEPGCVHPRWPLGECECRTEQDVAERTLEEVAG